MGEGKPLSINTVANFLSVQFFVGLIFMGVTSAQNLIPNDSFCIYGNKNKLNYIYILYHMERNFARR